MLQNTEASERFARIDGSIITPIDARDIISCRIVACRRLAML